MERQPVSKWVEVVSSPAGEFTVAATARGICAVGLPGSPAPGRADPGAGDVAREIARAGASQLAEYLAGRRWRFDLPLDAGGTEFQRAAWRVLADIAAGETITYGEQARRLGRPGAARAAGAANGANPVPIVVPCHRVVASTSLGGYAGGLALKIWLLDHERAATVCA